ncbi:MAG: PD-(D/E)XK nuclease family protein [Spirochaetota bacterium]
MENLSDRLVSRLKQQHVLVFPTELAARSWSEYLLLDPERFGLTAVREDRLISWDTCREQLFPRRNRDLQAADRMYRILFVQDLLARNRREVFFRLLVPPEHAENSAVFVTSLVRVCPWLPDMVEALKSAQGSTTLADLRHDIEQMLTEYTRFLENGGLYEPAFEFPKLDQEGLQAGGRHYVLCFPEVMQGFERLADQLEGSPHVELLRAQETAIPPLEVYENQVVEFKAAFQRLERLIQGGAAAEDIAVTLCDYDHMIEDIAYQGRLRGIPLRFTSGRRLSSYPAARLFGDIQRLVQDDFSLQSMKRLLLSRSYPWKYPERNRELVAFGIEASCLRNWRDGQGLERDIWKERLQKSGNKELLGYYSRMKNSLTALVAAEDVGRLWNQFHSLWQTLFLPWEESGNQNTSGVFPFCVEQLSRLRQAIVQTGEPEGPGPYQLWLTVLENTWYVPQQEPGGIAVYPYGISAGITPKHHILLGADKSHTSVGEDPYILLSDQQRDELSLTGRDLTDAMLSVYAASGEHLYVSCSRVSREGEQLPPSVFLEAKKTEEVPSERLDNDPYHQETQLWRGEYGRSTISLYPLQKNSFERALVSILSEGGLDATQKLPRGDSPVLQLSSRRLKGDSESFHLSPTSLDAYLACPFSWFLMKVLKLPEQQFEPDMVAARWVGELIHTCYERFFSWLIAQRGGIFVSDSIPEYLEVLTQIIEEVLAGSRRRWNSPAAVVWCQITRQLSEQLPQLFSCEKKELDGARSIETECELAWEDPSDSFKLVGRIDRVALLPSGKEVAVIDYKKKNRVKKKSFSAASSRPDSYQLPMYTFLWEQGQQSLPVSKALYLDVSEGTYVRVFPYQYQKVTVDREQFERVIEHMVQDAQAIAQRISLLDVRLASEESKTCQYCSFRDVCRGRFAVR